MPLHPQAGDTTAVATFPSSLPSKLAPREPLPGEIDPHPFPLDGRSPDTGVRPPPWFLVTDSTLPPAECLTGWEAPAICGR